MTFDLPLFALVYPEITLLIGACAALLADLFYGKRFPIAAFAITQIALVIAFFLTYYQGGQSAVISFQGLFIQDEISILLKLFILLSAFFVFAYSRSYIQDRAMPQGEYFVLALLSVLGMLILVSAHNLLMIYLGLELLSLPLYAMVALQRDAKASPEAALKYFIMGAVASGILLYGMSMIYGVTGSLDIGKIAALTSQDMSDHTLILSFALVFILGGIAFKLAAVPFHMWAPDVYVGAPTSVTLFIASVPKLAIMGMITRLLIQGLPDLLVSWQQIFIAMSILSMMIGNFLAIAQSNIKRMLAYSAIAHIGYFILGLVPGTPTANGAALFYIISYAITTAAAFGVLVIMSRHGIEVDSIEDLKGLNQRNPWLASMMLIVMFSLAGIPPTVGFVSKLFVLQALVNANLVWLAALALAFAIVGVFYYIRIVKQMYFYTPTEEMKPVHYSMDMQVLIGVNAMTLLLLGIFPSALIEACRMAFL